MRAAPQRTNELRKTRGISRGPEADPVREDKGRRTGVREPDAQDQVEYVHAPRRRRAVVANVLQSAVQTQHGLAVHECHGLYEPGRKHLVVRRRRRLEQGAPPCGTLVAGPGERERGL